MYCVVYEFTVDKKNEEKFKKLWHELTLKIIEECHSAGSRLHCVDNNENTWVAYAQWPSKEIYDNTPTKVSYEKIRQEFLSTCNSVGVIYQMECVDNLFTLSST